MAEQIQLEIVTPDRAVYSGAVEEVVLPSQDGYMGILPGHAPLLAQLDIGEVSYRVGQERQYLAVSGGFAEVLRGSVSILARTAELASEIDLERAKQAEERAMAKLDSDSSGEEFRLAEIRLKRAISRRQVRGRVPG